MSYEVAVRMPHIDRVAENSTLEIRDVLPAQFVFAGTGQVTVEGATGGQRSALTAQEAQVAYDAGTRTLTVQGVKENWLKHLMIIVTLSGHVADENTASTFTNRVTFTYQTPDKDPTKPTIPVTAEGEDTITTTLHIYYNVRFTTDGKGSLTGKTVYSVREHRTFGEDPARVIPTAVPAKGHEFIGWYVKKGDTLTAVTTDTIRQTPVEGDTVYIAVFKPFASLNKTVDSNDMHAGEMLTYTITAELPYELKGGTGFHVEDTLNPYLSVKEADVEAVLVNADNAKQKLTKDEAGLQLVNGVLTLDVKKEVLTKYRAVRMEVTVPTWISAETPDTTVIENTAGMRYESRYFDGKI